jgi:signal recognition particle GTPase
MANITKRNDSYLIRVSAGFDGTGKRIHKCLTWKPPADMTPKQAEKEAKRQAMLFEEKCLSGQILDSNMKLNEFIDIWLTSYAEPQLRPKTRDRYKQLLPRIRQALGHMKLEKIQPHHLNLFYENLSEESIREDVKYHATADLRPLLKEKCITQTIIAERTGVGINTIASAVSGKTSAARQLCNYVRL